VADITRHSTVETGPRRVRTGFIGYHKPRKESIICVVKGDVAVRQLSIYSRQREIIEKMD
jgi:hypothetical protein